MDPGTVVRVVGGALASVGLVLLVATGAVASALGAQGGAQAVAGASDPSSLAFWFQLSFIRLFGTTLAGLGVILLWCGAHLGADQQRSLLKVMAGSLGAVAVMAVGQQVAIWSSTAGWVLAGFLVSVAVACLMSARWSLSSQAA
jgi:hypothetical protein